MRVVVGVLLCALLVFVTLHLAGGAGEGADSIGDANSDENLSERQARTRSKKPGAHKKKGVRRREGGGGAVRAHENPHAREIREALDTPVQNFFASVSPVWVQIRRVLKTHGEERFQADVNEVIVAIKDARRTIGFEGEYLLGRQNTLMEGLWSADFDPALRQDLAEPLRVLGERTEAFTAQ